MRSKKDWCRYWCLLLGLASSIGGAAEQKYLTVRNLPATVVVRGKSANVPLEIEIGKEFHIQANPAATPQLIPTKLEMERQADLTFQAVRYPPGKPYRLQSSPQEILVYSGRLKIVVPVTASAKAPLGGRRLKGKLRFQACNETICFFPLNLPVEIPVRIKAK